MSARPRRPGQRAWRFQAEDGVATLIFPMLLWVAVVAGVALVDVGAYLVAAARAQQLADASALAAVSVDVPPGGGDPRVEARRVTDAGGGRLDACDCRRGSEQASVTVSVPVDGLFVPTFWARRVSADADAVLTDAWTPGSP
ncbi:pilus assembly protein TadG-related protein [Egicoccus sp. AB-alg2]|uniref:pilus assembly protein TadG-related protein n=1 Tax=Egicoccus sp. AB-alg2 TaxID=3242693 RepID=UPI00359EB8B2